MTGSTPTSRYITCMTQDLPRKRGFRAATLVAALVPIALVMMIPDAHAAGIFDTVVNSFKTLEPTWFGRLSSDARFLFTTLLGIEFAWLGAQWLLARRTMDEIVPSLLRKVIVAGLFFAILVNANVWITDLLNGFTVAGQNASGMGILSPSTIMSYGITDTISILTGAHPTAAHSGGGGWFAWVNVAGDVQRMGMFFLELIERVLIAVMVFMAFFLIAMEMAVLLVESYLILGAGVLFLGFGGSRWTTRFVDAYLNYAVSIGTKLFVLYLIVGALTATVIPTLNTDLNAVSNNVSFSSLLVSAVTMAMAALLAKRIPDHAGALLGAGTHLTGAALGGELGRAAMTGGTVAAIGMTGGAAAAGGGMAALGGGASGMAGAQAATIGGAGATQAAAAGGGVAASSGAAGVAAPAAAGAPASGAAAPAQLASAAGPAAPSPGAAPGAPAPGVAAPGQPSAPAGHGGPQAPSGSEQQSQPPQRFADMMRRAQTASRAMHHASHGSESRVSASHISTSHGNDG